MVEVDDILYSVERVRRYSRDKEDLCIYLRLRQTGEISGSRRSGISETCGDGDTFDPASFGRHTSSLGRVRLIRTRPSAFGHLQNSSDILLSFCLQVSPFYTYHHSRTTRLPDKTPPIRLPALPKMVSRRTARITATARADHSSSFFLLLPFQSNSQS